MNKNYKMQYNLENTAELFSKLFLVKLLITY